jgi:hypothetical protein
MKNVSKAQAEETVGYQLKNGWRLRPHQKEHPKGLSQTVPDDSYSIKDLIRKFAGNLDPNITLLGEYNGEDEEVDYDDLDVSAHNRSDLSEQQETRERNARQLQLLQQLAEQNQGAEKKRVETAEATPAKADDLRHDTEDAKPEKRSKKYPQTAKPETDPD